MPSASVRTAAAANAGLREQIVRLVLRDAAAPAVVGIALGIIASLWWTDTLRVVLYGIESDDPATYALVSAGVLVMVILSSLMPALRASRADPATTLRAE